MKIISVVGTRPNFIKIAPIYYALKQKNVTHLLCHTGQHYDEKMSKSFFIDLELPTPDYFLAIGSGTHGKQTAKAMIEFEKVLIAEKPDLVIVVGDVNSTLACALAAVKLNIKLNIKIAHIEAGLRSFDRTMPEEINRILTDQISDYLFVTEKSGLVNLKKEGIAENKIFFVGNIMIDSLIKYCAKAKGSKILEHLNIKSPYALITLHRPSNVDDKESLTALVDFMNNIATKISIIFPIHPRTKQKLTDYELITTENIKLIEPVSYIDFLYLQMHAQLVITDSGGIQEETTYLGIQCITLRTSTERPSTIEEGTNQLLGNDFKKAEETVSNIINGNTKHGSVPELWDGRTAERIVNVLLNNSQPISQIVNWR